MGRPPAGTQMEGGRDGLLSRRERSRGESSPGKEDPAAYGAIKPTTPPPALVTLQFVAREIMLAGSDARPTDIGQWKADVRTRSEKELPVKGDTSVVGNPQAGAGVIKHPLFSHPSTVQIFLAHSISPFYPANFYFIISQAPLADPHCPSTLEVIPTDPIFLQPNNPRTPYPQKRLTESANTSPSPFPASTLGKRKLSRPDTERTPSEDQVSQVEVPATHPRDQPVLHK
jgi:hypothetical protein